MSNITRYESDEVEIDLLQLAMLVVRKLPAILLCALIFGAAAYGGTKLMVTPKYEASVTLYVNNYNSADMETSMISTSDLTASAKLVDTYAAIIKSNSVLKEVLAKVDCGMSTQALREGLSTAAVNGTEVFKVKIRHEVPKTAADLANAIAEVAPDQISQIVEGSSVKVIDYADIPTGIAEPSYKKMALLGMLLGAGLCIALIVLLDLIDTTIQSSEDFAMWNLPILSVIPDHLEAERTGSGAYSEYANNHYGKEHRRKE